MNEVQIRRRTASDIEPLVQLLSTAGYPTRDTEYRTWLLHHQAQAAWVILRDGAIVGHVQVSGPERDTSRADWEKARPRWAGRMAVISRLFVDSHRRRHSIGTQLLCVAIDHIWRGGRLPVLDVRVQDLPLTASLYHHIGFQRVSSSDPDVKCMSDLLRRYRVPGGRHQYGPGVRRRSVPSPVGRSAPGWTERPVPVASSPPRPSGDR